jgi:hypothetical protein
VDLDRWCRQVAHQVVAVAVAVAGGGTLMSQVGADRWLERNENRTAR